MYPNRMVSFQGHTIQKQILRLGSLCDSQIIAGGLKSVWTSTQNKSSQRLLNVHKFSFYFDCSVELEISNR